jgi:hypothetical protein
MPSLAATVGRPESSFISRVRSLFISGVPSLFVTGRRKDLVFE